MSLRYSMTFRELEEVRKWLKYLKDSDIWRPLPESTSRCISISHGGGGPVNTERMMFQTTQALTKALTDHAFEQYVQTVLMAGATYNEIRVRYNEEVSRRARMQNEYNERRSEQ